MSGKIPEIVAVSEAENVVSLHSFKGKEPLRPQEKLIVRAIALADPMQCDIDALAKQMQLLIATKHATPKLRLKIIELAENDAREEIDNPNESSFRGFNVFSEMMHRVISERTSLPGLILTKMNIAMTAMVYEMARNMNEGLEAEISIEAMRTYGGFIQEMNHSNENQEGNLTSPISIESIHSLSTRDQAILHRLHETFVSYVEELRKAYLRLLRIRSTAI